MHNWCKVHQYRASMQKIINWSTNYHYIKICKVGYPQNNKEAVKSRILVTPMLSQSKFLLLLSLQPALVLINLLNRINVAILVCKFEYRRNGVCIKPIARKLLIHVSKCFILIWLPNKVFQL